MVMTNREKSEKDDLFQLIELASKRTSGIVFEGFAKDDNNIPNHLLIVESSESIFSFSKNDILDQEPLSKGRVRVWVSFGAKAFHISPFSVGGYQTTFAVGMENIAPPALTFDPEAPQLGSAVDIKIEEGFTILPALSAVATNWKNSCLAGDSYDNNCAHFLSDAFIRAGYIELFNANPHINARCTPSAKRPIRAREMWSWFRTKAVRTSNTLQRNTGWWAVFQLKEDVYWGGHVALLDSNRWVYYGTGWYHNWNQYLYQW
jgi:hypothetical protein